MTDDELNRRFDQIEENMRQMEDRLVERMRDMQMELLRGFEAFSAGQFAQRP